VLLLGESGSGKELVARALHKRSARGRRSMVCRNAATFPEALIDAEVFGNAKNYPNPGTPDRKGLVGEADGSTLFLDEIGELPEHLQAHLLRVLDEGEYQRLGEARARTADLRLIAATNRPVGRLKHDFLARFPLRLTLPPLRDRVEDIPLLALHLLRQIAGADRDLAVRFFDDGVGGPVPRVSLELVEGLIAHNFPANVRELEHVLWSALLTSPGRTLRLTSEVGGQLLAPSAGERTEPVDITPEALRDSLRRHGGVQARVWRELGLKNRWALRRLIRKLEGEGWTFDE